MNLYDISWQVDEKTYRQDPALSYSTIAKFSREGFSKLSTLFDKVESPSLLFGSLVDTLLTEPDKFEELYAVGELPELSDSLQAIAVYLSENYSDYNSVDMIPAQTISEVGVRFGYFTDPKYEKTRIKRIKENCEEYFQMKKRVGDKTLISLNLYKEAKDCVDELKSNEYTKWYFEDNNPFDPTIERFYQLKFKGSYQYIPLRMMADLIIVDNVKKEIIPCDLKTSYKHESEFFKSYLEWAYYHQSNLYSYIIRQNIEKHSAFRGYTIKPYRFIVISRGSKSPMVWEDTSSYSRQQKYTLPSGYIIPNWQDQVVILDSYLKQSETPKYPEWTEKLNDIWEHINKRYEQE